MRGHVRERGRGNWYAVLSVRDPETGKPSPSPEIFKQFLPRIKQQTGAILNITTGGGLGMTLDERLAAAKWAQPEVASMNMGSMNFNISGAGAKSPQSTRAPRRGDA